MHLRRSCFRPPSTSTLQRSKPRAAIDQGSRSHKKPASLAFSFAQGAVHTVALGTLRTVALHRGDWRSSEQARVQPSFAEKKGGSSRPNVHILHLRCSFCRLFSAGVFHPTRSHAEPLPPRDKLKACLPLCAHLRFWPAPRRYGRKRNLRSSPRACSTLGRSPRS